MPAASDVRHVPIDQLTYYPGNARRGDIDRIKRSLTRLGQYRTIVVRDTGDALVILAGNNTTRGIQALINDPPPADAKCPPAFRKQLAGRLVRCEVAQYTDAEAAIVNQNDNRLNDLAYYDEDELDTQLGALRAAGDLDGLAWTLDELDERLRNLDAGPGPGGGDPDEIPEPPADPITRPGDIWQIGPHRLICGDCRDPATLDRLLDGAKVNVGFTSPPYASQRAYDESSGFRPIPPAEYVQWFEAVQGNVWAHLAADGSWFVNIKEHAADGQRDLYVKDLTIAHVRRWGWRFVDELCWVDACNGLPGGWNNRFKDAWEPVFHYSIGHKIKFHPFANGTATDKTFDYSPANPKSNSGSGLLGAVTDKHEGVARPSNVVTIAAGGDGTHPAQFPVALPAWFIRAYSDPGDTVLDPFAGSGTALVAAHLEQRIGYGVELSPAYCDVTVERFRKLTGIEPELTRA